MSKINEEHGLISSVQQLRRTNHKDFQNCQFACYLSQIEPKKPIQALKDPRWVEAMHDELLQFKLLKVWTLVDLPKDKWAIGIDYEEVFAPVARIEAIRLFIAYASFKDFIVYQMDVKSAFLYGKIEEEVYVCQPPSFEDPTFPDKVYKVEKALYGLHHTPRAWYETLSTYLLNNGIDRGQIDKTLFIKRHKDNILLVHVYVDDIIFGSTKKELSIEFEKLMHDNQDKYVAEILKKFDFATIKIASTPMEPNKVLIKDEEAKDVDAHLCISMIGSLMYLTTSRPDITFAVYVCARFQVTPKTSLLNVVKRIFKYLKASLDRKFTIGGCQFLGKRLISWQCKKQIIVANSTTKAEYVTTATCYGQTTKISQSSGSTNLVADETVYKELGDRMERAATTSSSFEAEQDNGSGPRCQYTILGVADAQTSLTLLLLVFVYAAKYTLNAVRHKLMLPGISLLGTDCLPNDTIFKELARMGYEKPSQSAKTTAWNGFCSTMASAIIYGFSGNVTPLFETMMVQATEEVVLDLQKAKITQAKEIATLKKRVKKLERKRRSRPTGLRRLRKFGAASRVESSKDKNSLDNAAKVTVKDTVAAKIVTTAKIKAAKPKIITAVTTDATSITTTVVTRPKAKGIVFYEHEQTYKPTVSSNQPSVKDKGKGIMIKPERPLKKKDQITVDE
ncbi:putative ribonuclease H-like domain-containing protein [Tanacetum coccineum]|uniref:Ribonuclease H-like domain-containing protein n=1 Tax=Tanacetum coccineum TaxID=301880 RepID=A0ABQ5DW64_9ASTR